MAGTANGLASAAKAEVKKKDIYEPEHLIHDVQGNVCRRATLKELAAEYGVSARTLRRRVAGGMPLEQAVTAPARQMDRYKASRSLCWYCANSTNGSKCPWARSFTPVAGWEAEKTQIKGNGKGAEGYVSYNVRKCPLYRADGKAMIFSAHMPELSAGAAEQKGG